MDLDEYQRFTRETAIYPRGTLDIDVENTEPFELDLGVMYTTLGLNGETGEIGEDVKKALRGAENPADAVTADELGDVLWYLARLADEAGYSLTEIAAQNQAKLTDRQDNDELHDHD